MRCIHGAFLLLVCVAAEDRALVSRRVASNAEPESGASGVIYVVRHAETDGSVKPHGINAKGLRRAAFLTTIFDGSVFESPASIIAAQVKGHVQRMEDTVYPVGQNLGVHIDETVGPLSDESWSEEPCKDAAKKAMTALEKGPVLIAWWSYIESLCKELGHKCPGGVSDFQGNDQVLVATVENGKVKTMKMGNQNFVDPGPQPTPPTPPPTPAPVSPYCQTGLLSPFAGYLLMEQVCCDPGCGQCGGGASSAAGACENRPGGEYKCCTHTILYSGLYCDAFTDTACILPSPQSALEI